MMRKQTAIWTTKDGQRIRICDMTDEHLLNAIRFFRRKGAAYKEASVAVGYRVLSSLQGEMATFFCEQDIARLEETSLEDFIISQIPQFEKLLAEAERRPSITEKDLE